MLEKLSCLKVFKTNRDLPRLHKGTVADAETGREMGFDIEKGTKCKSELGKQDEAKWCAPTVWLKGCNCVCKKRRPFAFPTDPGQRLLGQERLNFQNSAEMHARLNMFEYMAAA